LNARSAAGTNNMGGGSAPQVSFIN
jgi:hypothetical protein